jgi:hypothetical protein
MTSSLKNTVILCNSDGILSYYYTDHTSKAHYKPTVATKKKLQVAFLCHCTVFRAWLVTGLIIGGKQLLTMRVMVL